eukprot:7357309-Alexandrium_andersonii.AAC.1
MIRLALKRQDLADVLVRSSPFSGGRSKDGPSVEHLSRGPMSARRDPQPSDRNLARPGGRKIGRRTSRSKYDAL